MEPYEIDEALKTFSVICDTREQDTPKARKRFKALGVPVERATMSYGDYCGNVILDGKPLHITSSKVSAPAVIERKMSLDELAGNFGRDRKRFQREFERARDAGARVYLLVENASWEAILNHRYKSRLHPNAFMASLVAWAVRYGAVPVFCKEASSGRVIKEILYRDMKERLERGEYG